MRTIRRILVAVKDAESKSKAVTKAAQLALALHAKLELFHAIDTPLYANAFGTGGEPVNQQQFASARYRGQFERIAARLARHGIAVTTTVIWDYPPYEAILRQARRSNADLVVAERHAGRHVAPRMLHITDWELLRRCNVPLLLVKSPRPYHRPVVLATIDPLHRHAKPARLDGEILRVATTVSAALRGTLHAAHAYQARPIATFGTEDGAVSGDLIARIEANAKATARAGFERALRTSSIPKTRRHLIAGPPAATIRAISTELHSAIVVIGAISRSGLKQLFIGSTAERVLDQIACDLLIVKPAGFLNRVHRTPRGARTINTIATFP
jgi:universal stress protein E